jgi:transketolase
VNPYFSSLQPWGGRIQQLRGAPADQRQSLLEDFARELRVCVLNVIKGAQLGHIGGDFSIADTLTTLFGGVLRYDPANPQWPERDRFIMSKGHCSASLYSVLALSGFIAPQLLDTFAQALSPLNGHPNRNKVPGVETNTGPLGHGLPVAVGCAMAARLSGASWRTFVALGDGELQEGSNWEAIMFAGHQGLSGLTAIVDRNRLQQGARTEDTNRLEPLADKWRAFGWEVREIDGHDYNALYDAFTAERDNRPRCVIAKTVKGRGVSFMEDGVQWHHKVPSAEQFEQACSELGVTL